MRVTSDFFVSALIRRAGIAGAFAGLRRRGGAEAGAIFVVLDRLDGTFQLFGPAPQSDYGDDLDRAFTPLHKGETIDREAMSARLDKEIRFDPDCWIVEIEDRDGRHFLDRVV
jgi:hypothetical protein